MASSKIKNNFSGPVSLVDWHKRGWSWQNTVLAWAVPHWDWKTNHLVKKQSHSGRFTHELGVLWVILWKETCCCPKFAFCLWRIFLLAVWLYFNAFSPDFPLSSFHRIWWQFLISWPLIDSLQVKSLVAKRSPSQILDSLSRVICRTSSTYCLCCLAACSGVFEQYAQVVLIHCSHKQP